MTYSVRSLWAASVGAALAVALSTVSCGAEKPNKEKAKGEPQKTVQENGQPNTSSGPTGSPGSVTNAPGLDAGLTPLWNAIQQGMHKDSSEADKTRIVVQEAQRCRQKGATIVGAGLSATVIPHEELIATYRARHWGPNALSACRRSLGLILSVGSVMKLENLIELENCSRLQESESLANQADRQSQRDVLMLENLSLLCSLSNDELTTEVHSALSSGIVQTWTVRSN